MVLKDASSKLDGFCLEIVSFPDQEIDDPFHGNILDQSRVGLEARQQDGQIVVVPQKVGEVLEVAFEVLEIHGVKDVERLHLLAQVLPTLPPDMKQGVGWGISHDAHPTSTPLVDPLQPGGNDRELVGEGGFASSGVHDPTT